MWTCTNLLIHICPHLFERTHRKKKSMLARRWELEQGQLVHPESSSRVPLQITSWQLQWSPLCASYNACACWSLPSQLPPDSCSGWHVHTSYMSTIISSQKEKKKWISVYNLPQDKVTSYLPCVVNHRTLCPISNRCPQIWAARRESDGGSVKREGD